MSISYSTSYLPAKTTQVHNYIRDLNFTRDIKHKKEF